MGRNSLQRMEPREAQAVILAAGEGRRLAPLTNTRPKPMLPVANRPILEHVLEAVVAAGVERVVFVVGYQQERIRTYFGDGQAWGASITYVEQPTQLGTGHAVLQAERTVDGPFLVLNGDRIVDPTVVRDVCAAYGREEDAPIIAVTHVAHPSTLGVVDLAGDRLVSIEEGPLDPAPTELVNAGVYAFPPAIFDAIRTSEPTEGDLSVTAALNDIAAETAVIAIRYDGTWLDVTHLWDLPVVNAARIDAPMRADGAGATLVPPSLADDVAVGANVHVGPGAALMGGVAIGDHASIGPTATLENVVVLPDATIDAGAVVRNAIIGANAHVGANTTIAGTDADVIVDGVVHRGVKLGGVVGDNVTIGSGVVFSPGAIVGDGARVGTGSYVTGWIEPNAVIRRG